MKQATRLFKALSDETRLRILGLLLGGELCVCELMAILELPQSTVSRHLSYLKNSRLVEDRRAGIWMHYQLAADDNQLHRRLLELLHQDLPRLPQVREDQKRLRKYHASNKPRKAVCVDSR